MPDTATLAVFVGASLALLVIPGPAVMYIIARGVHQGRSAALVSTLGIEVGTLIQLLVATAGLSAIVSSSDLAFMALKYAGAGYLIWLATSALLDSAGQMPDGKRPPDALRPIFLQGILVEVLNPKTAIFFLAFLPQFADPARGPVAWQILVLGLLFVLLAIFNDGLIGLLAGTLGDRLRGGERVMTAQRYAACAVYLSLAAFTAMRSPVLA